MSRLVQGIIYLLMAILCILGGFFGYAISSMPDVRSLARQNPETTAFIEYRKKEAQREGIHLQISQQWISLNDIPQLLRRTIIVSEDASFWVHNGFDWFEVKEAWDRNLEEGRIVRGASTISQQTAKNLYLTPSRSVYRKFREFLITRELENHLTKSRILEIYLNCIEFGNGIFGINSASYRYFGRHPRELTIFQMVRLAAIIPNPLKLNPTVPSRELRWRSKVILNRLYNYKFISQDDYLNARSELRRFFQ